MNTLALSAMLQLSMVSAGANTYADAHQQNIDSGRPIVVLVGADWCPACRQMKSALLPHVGRQGLLGKVAFAVVNTDREGPLARRLMRGGSIPQLVMYHKTSQGWRRDSLIGAQSTTSIASFIDQGTKSATTTVSTK